MAYTTNKVKFTIATVLGLLGFWIDNARAWQSDNGDDTFTNQLLYASYPDRDTIRVGNDFCRSNGNSVQRE